MWGLNKFLEGVWGIIGFVRGEDGGGLSLLFVILLGEFNKFEFFELFILFFLIFIDLFKFGIW